ncbi:TerC family protein [Gimibacter soli]|uniref:TerC family protein n=1 Tax=Gimibacter soli TaxID=3024400 RepID=A0AAE9XV24_9PROT|nr:TerC family protein [Gimibacter soli]WCL55731.1 TerC family protein [Gimibacter soli]
MDFLLDPAVWAAFITLTALEIVLGIDNLIVISILTDRLKPEEQASARKLGLAAALVTRLMLLSLAFFIAQMEAPLFTAFGEEFSWRDLLLIAGGLFLLAKGTLEIHHNIEDKEADERRVRHAAFMAVIFQIAVMDIVFSFDSVMTAVGIADHLSVMVAAILISMIIMVLAVNQVAGFINRHPTVKILGLSYMLLIGLTLIGDGLGQHIPKGYLYFAMAFSFFVEVLNMTARNRKAARDTATEKN